MRWVFKDPIENVNIFRDRFKLDPLMARLLMRRGVDTDEKLERFFWPDYEAHLHDPFFFHALPSVIERIREAMNRKEKVGVFGDFDADGVTGSAVLREALEGLGLEVVVHIPDKVQEGHGISRQGIEKFSEAGVTLLFTVDCGISNLKEVDEANALGMNVVIIDHHHIPPVLPRALASINPKMPESGYPFRDLCGAGTAFKVMQGVYQKLKPEKLPQLKWLLDLVALGTIADCMPLIDENRVLVKYGLIVLSKTKRPGLQELYSVGNIRIDENNVPDSVTVGFQIAPRINAAGRMAHAQTAHDLLVSSDISQAKYLASQLENYNRDRQKVSTSIVEDIRKVVEKKFSEKKFILVSESHYPLGIVGLAAGRIAEEFGKPTAVLQKGERVSQGSFRSIPGFNIIRAIEECSDLLEKFGGHEQAAGMTIGNDNIEKFYDRFHAIIEREMSGIVLNPEIAVEETASGSHASLDFVRMLKKFEPFGEGNPEPIFLFSRVQLVEARLVGKTGKHIKVKLHIPMDGGNQLVDGIGFGLAEKLLEIDRGDTIDVIGMLRENVWNGNSSVQIYVLDMRISEE